VQAAVPISPLLAVPNVTAHPSTASAPITVMLYSCPLLSGFNVFLKGLTRFATQLSSSAVAETARCLWSWNILLSYSRLLKVIRNNTLE